MTGEPEDGTLTRIGKVRPINQRANRGPKAGIGPFDEKLPVGCASSYRPGRRTQTEVRIGGGERDMALLALAIREWVVPTLVRDFLAEHPIGAARTEPDSDKRTIGPHGKEGAGSTRMDPNGQ